MEGNFGEVEFWDLLIGFLGAILALSLYLFVRNIVIPILRRRGVIGRPNSQKWSWALDLVFLGFMSLHMFLVLSNFTSLGGVFLVAIFIGGLAYLIVPLFKDSLWGLYYFWIGNINLGDMVTVGTITGYVRELGILATRIEDLEDNSHVVPVSYLREHGVKKVIQSEMLEVNLFLPKVKMDLEELHTRLLFAPYIAPGSEVAVNRKDSGVEIKLHLIHATFKEPVRRYVERLV